MVRYQKGHKNSEGKRAEWVIVSHKDGHIISSHKTKKEAEKHLKDIQKFKHIKESMKIDEAKEILNKAGYLVESYADKADAIIKKYCGSASEGTLEEIEKIIEKELGKKPKVSTDRIHQVIWIETEEFTIIGYYQFDEDTGETYVNPQTVKFPNEEQDYIDDPV